MSDEARRDRRDVGRERDVRRTESDHEAPVEPCDERFVARLVRYARQNPGTVEGVYTSPSHPEVQARVHEVWMDLARRYDLDGIHFDYIRFPSARYDYSVGALERFRFWVRDRLPRERFATLDEAYAADLLAFLADFRMTEWHALYILMLAQTGR